MMKSEGMPEGGANHMMKPQYIPEGLSRVERYEDPRIGERWHIMVGARLITVCDDKEIASYLVDCFNLQEEVHEKLEKHCAGDLYKFSFGFRRWATGLFSGKVEANARKMREVCDLYSQGKLGDMEFINRLKPILRKEDIGLLLVELKEGNK